MIQPSFSVETTNIEGLFTVQFKIFEDDRGSVMEFYRQSDFANSILPSLDERPHLNAPLTVKGALRGIHAEFANKLVSVACGEVYAVIVDLRKESPTAGEWLGFQLKRGNGLFVSKGLGNSFQTTSDDQSIYLYYFEQEWRPDMPGQSCNPLDADLAIDWPIPANEGMILSEKDLDNPSLREILSS